MKKRIFAFLALLPLVTFNSFLFSADEEEVDAVVVTGSYIKTDREEIDIPVDVFDRGEYGAAGAPNMREVLRNMIMKKNGKIIKLTKKKSLTK